jgi:transcription antitermination factor NusG
MWTDNDPWYAIQVRQRAEKLAATLLTNKGYEPFLPTYAVKRQWSDRVKTFDQPLFPGYIFARLDVTKRLPVLTTPGVIGIVGAGKNPIAVPDSEVEAIWRVVNSNTSAEPWPFLEAGETVVISSGPLQGIEGLVVQVKNKFRVVVSIQLLQRSIAVEVGPETAVPTRVARAGIADFWQSQIRCAS